MQEIDFFSGAGEMERIYIFNMATMHIELVNVLLPKIIKSLDQVWELSL
jgi:hypothetical protein